MAIENLAGPFAWPVDLIHPSKITVPPARGVARPHLVARIERAAWGKLTVLAAPAGWGKTSLLAEWAVGSSMNVAWVSLDQGDNTPTRFPRALIAALDHIHPLQLDDVSTMLRWPTPAILDEIDAVLVARLEHFPESTAIVFDDVQVLTDPDILRFFSRVLEHLPPSIHLVAAGRGELRIPLARLRSAGAVTVLRAADLAFTVPEATSMLGDLAGAPLDPDDVAMLVERTEGWIAGLRLAGVSLANQRDSRAAIERLHGTQRDIADYFCEEVLSWLDPALRLLLVETSILPTFSELLCAAVTGCANAHELLTQTTGADLFVFPLDDERAWYRYHGLFRDLLLADFARLPDARRAGLHTRASEWYERHGLIREAVEHALSAHDLARAAALIDTHADTLMFACGETNLLAGWIDRFPDDLLVARPTLLRVHAWALTTVGRIDHAERLMLRVRDLFASAPAASAQERDAQLAAVRARIAAYRGDHEATVQHGREALGLLDPLRHGKIHGDVVLSIGFAERALGNTETAATAFGDAARLGRLHGNVQAARWGVRYLALTRMSQGRLNEAEAIVDEDLDRVREELADPGSMLPALLMSKAEILVERNDLAAARPLLERAMSIVQIVGDAKILHNAYIAMGTLLLAEGRPAEAREKMRRAEEIFPSAIRGARVAWMALIQGNAVEARRWAESSGFSTDDAAEPARGEYEQVIFARICAMTDPSPATFGLADRLIEDAERGGRFGRAIELLTIAAIAAHRNGNPDLARHSLGRALAYARHEGFVRVFLNEGREMQGLLRDLARDRAALDDPTRHYVMDLLNRFPTDSAPGQTASPLAEPLTARQVEILRLLADGRSNREIAGRLYIAEGTVKAHLHQLFGKLMARNRTEAVANARELRLLG
ncbi:MAG: hypothetical protein H0V37_12220 [Chloroflexia bacterium]|nr:hypothetical protein [Chloroflexia bacterium]